MITFLMVALAVTATLAWSGHRDHHRHHHDRRDRSSSFVRKLGKNSRRGQLIEPEVQFALDVAALKGANGANGAPASKDDEPHGFFSDREPDFDTTFELLKEYASPSVASQLDANGLPSAKEVQRKKLLRFALVQHLRSGLEGERAARKERLWQNYADWYNQHPDVVGLLAVHELEDQLGHNHHGEFHDQGERQRSKQKVDDK